MVAESAGRVPRDWALSPLAHNGYLQALSDGGLLLGVPFLVAVLVVTALAMRLLWRAVRRRQFSLGGFVVPLVLLAVLAHSAVDFDWSYPADLALAAVLAGLVVAQPRPPQRQKAVRLTTHRAVGALATAAAVATLVVAALAARPGDLGQNLPVDGGFGIKQQAAPADIGQEPSPAAGSSSSLTRTR
jgi:O-antigen ligase